MNFENISSEMEETGSSLEHVCRETPLEYHTQNLYYVLGGNNNKLGKRKPTVSVMISSKCSTQD